MEKHAEKNPYAYLTVRQDMIQPKIIDCEDYLDYISAVQGEGRKIMEKDGTPVVPDYAIKTNPDIAWARIMRGRPISFGHIIAKYVPQWKSHAIRTGKKRGAQGRRKERSVFRYLVKRNK